jgi:hypothetical protein
MAEERLPPAPDLPPRPSPPAVPVISPAATDLTAGPCLALMGVETPGAGDGGCVPVPTAAVAGAVGAM